MPLLGIKFETIKVELMECATRQVSSEKPWHVDSGHGSHLIHPCAQLFRINLSRVDG